ncbi:uncharacterized protein STEHIDRAFT_163507 [Stereum hirsutum FP-91666 SS1]|uniref:Uncharacterized protein n=1 Tax=Stereum hirsutum (strain FP-91666) TaxID=721885 RepID=R7RY07_STEHR|nr:uncharacterized protein STEHIDRAFT_163507 [Stereum hirsutum FP-91666 SS1]EIM79683.1 hypothetical protein STEHIDRAFT_163507 [Stereum hirsutum FP-91666 SS1]
MLFSFTKVVFATLAFGVAAVSAIPTPAPANAVAKHGGEDVLALLASVKADVDVDIGKLNALVAADVTLDVLGPIVADIKVKIDLATTTVKGYGPDQWQGDSANDISVSINALIVALIDPINRIKGLNGDVTIINVFADIDISLGGLLNAILALVSVDVSVNIKLNLVLILAPVVVILHGLDFTVLLNILAIL